MNELQKVEFDLLRCFIETCEKLNLNYLMIEGSALGAVRHSGFIPWDDDLDLGMYREDFNKFMELAPPLLPEGIFLQNYRSDPEYPYLLARLRNSNTTYIQKVLKNLKINHGIFIDIFPLDGYPESVKEQKKLERVKMFYSLQNSCGLQSPKTIKGKLFIAMLKLFGCHKRTAKNLAKLEKYLSQYPVKGSLYICNHGSPYGKRDYICSKYYGTGVDGVFEGVNIRIPESYDGYLTALYGDWRTPPPLEKQVGHHYYEVCDTKKPYTEYMPFIKNK